MRSAAEGRAGAAPLKSRRPCGSPWCNYHQAAAQRRFCVSLTVISCPSLAAGECDGKSPSVAERWWRYAGRRCWMRGWSPPTAEGGGGRLWGHEEKWFICNNSTFTVQLELTFSHHASCLHKYNTKKQSFKNKSKIFNICKKILKLANKLSHQNIFP